MAKEPTQAELWKMRQRMASESSNRKQQLQIQQAQKPKTDDRNWGERFTDWIQEVSGTKKVKDKMGGK